METPLKILVTYRTKPGMARAFFEAAAASGLPEAIRHEEGNTGYRYYLPMEQEDTLILLSCWNGQTAADHHSKFSENTKQMGVLKKDYVLSTEVERLCSFD